MVAIGEPELRHLVRDHVGPAMDTYGFARHKNKLFWSRRPSEVEQAIALLRRRGSVDMQWALIVPEATPLLWGHPHPIADIGYHVMSGSPASIRHPAPGQSFALTDLTTVEGYDEVASRVRQNLQLVAEFMGRFDRRGDIRDHLINADRKGGRDFLMPTAGLVPATAAILAILDLAPDRYELVEQAVERLERNPGPISRGRVDRLRAALT